MDRTISPQDIKGALTTAATPSCSTCAGPRPAPRPPAPPGRTRRPSPTGSPDLGAALSVARRIQRVSPYPREADKDT